MKKVFSLLLVLGLLVTGVALAEDVDTTTAASQNYYGDVSLLTLEDLIPAITAFKGACTFATVNEDGSPNLAVFVPGITENGYIVSNQAPNATQTNIRRTKQAVIAYYIYNPEATERAEKYGGARLVVTLEEDPAILEELIALNERYSENTLFLKIEEILPLG